MIILDVFDDAMELDTAKLLMAAAKSTSPKPNKHNSRADIATATPYPKKRPRIESEFDILQSVIGYDINLMGDIVDVLLDQLSSELVSLKQNKAKNKAVLKYKHRGKDISFVRVPVNNSTEGFNKQDLWLDSALKSMARSHHHIRVQLGPRCTSKRTTKRLLTKLCVCQDLTCQKK